MIATIVPRCVAVVDARGGALDAQLLPSEAAALGCVSPKRRREFTIARSCARRALAALGLPPTPILPGPNREPLWPASVVGSITHCQGYHAAAIAHRSQLATIGIDAEIHNELPQGVLDMVALDVERDWLQMMSETGIYWDRLLFSAKESVYKAWFQIAGRWLDFKDIHLLIRPEAGTFSAFLLTGGKIDDRQNVSNFQGRYLVEGGLILTAVVMWAR